MLPTLPYANTKSEIETVAFRGLNLTENTREGDISSSYGITLDSYPCIKTSHAKQTLKGYSSPVDFFEFDGHLTVIDNNFLWFDGTKIASVSNARKQWAVVNREIVLFPDKLKINVDTGVWGPMNTRGDSSGDVTFSQGTLTATIDPSYQSGYSQDLTGARWASVGGEVINDSYIYVYRGVKRKVIEEAWNSLTSIERTIASAVTNPVQAGDIFIPLENNGFFSADIRSAKDDLLDPPYIVGDFFCVVTKVEYEYSNLTGIVNYRHVIHYDVCRVGEGSAKFSEKFFVGQTVSVSLDGEITLADKTKITQISEEPNAITFKDVFSPRYHFTVSTDSAVGNLYIRISSTLHFNFTVDKPITAGSHVVVENFKDGETGRLFVYEPNTKAYTYYECKSSTSSGTVGERLYVTDRDLKITIERHVPDLDFITERENRLWGVCNADRTVYASALGDPAEFWQYDGVSTDSYAVAIGSEGEFTGICSHNSAIVIFKEEQIFKILGSFPEEYYMLDYQMTGLQKGCERSLCVINETLFYKGHGGIYTLGSSTPQLISYPLSSRTYSSAVATYDGRSYVIYLQKEDGTGGVYAYDLTHGVWVQTDDLKDRHVLAMCIVGQKLHYLVETDVREILKETNEPVSEWLCEFTPTDEGTFYEKIYTKLYISADLEENSSLEAWISVDGGEYKKVFEKSTVTKIPLTVPLLLPRSHKFQLKLCGTGSVLLRRISREAHVGGGK